MAEASRSPMIWNGQWQWDAKATVYSNPIHANVWKARWQDIKVDGDHMIMTTKETFADGSERTWVWDGKFDGVPRKMVYEDGSTELFISFVMLTDRDGGDVYIGGDAYGGGADSFRGAEHYSVDEKQIQIWGSITQGGKQFTYYEKWDRIS